jgi:uncharacterized cupredoxin-like copper-binding protein
MEGHPQLRSAAALAGCGLLAALAGCGGEDSSAAQEQAALLGTATPAPAATSAAAAPGAAVVTEVGEYTLRLARGSASAGRVTFAIRSHGSAVHEVIVLRSDRRAGALPTKGAKVEEEAAGTLVDEVEDVKPGTTARLTVHLAAGRYVLLCNLPGHYRRGMHAAFRVT